MYEPPKLTVSEPLYAPLQMSATGYLMVALTESKESALGPDDLRRLLSEYHLKLEGVALAVFDHEKQEWVKLAEEMLHPNSKGEQ